MMNMQAYNNYIDEVERRCSVGMDEATRSALVAGHLDAVLFHIVREVPGVTEYLERELVRLKELNDLERI
jgi:hypothetical protein